MILMKARLWAIWVGVLLGSLAPPVGLSQGLRESERESLAGRDNLPLKRAAELILPRRDQGMLPEIGDAVDCARQGPVGGLASGSGLFRVDVDLRAFPDAICNDGTGAIFYVRRYTNSENRDKWQIHLQGGGGCSSGESCANRWCSIDTNFGADKMTTRLAPDESIVATGIVGRTPDNPLGDWNQVLVYYCSSDSWTGRSRDVPLKATSPTGASVGYRMHFGGANIIDAVIETLRRRLGEVKYGQGGQTLVMPDLDWARQVFFSGSSAGGNGVQKNLDRLRNYLFATNLRCVSSWSLWKNSGDCPLEVRGVIDASFGPGLQELSLEETGFCREQGLCTYEQLFQSRWNNINLGLYQGGTTEDSCVDWHEQYLPGTEWRCSDGAHVMMHHISTPFFVRMDLQDSLVAGNFVEAGYSLDGRPASHDLFGKLVQQQLVGLRYLDQTAEEALTGDADFQEPAVFGPQCTQHESLRNRPAFFEAKAPDAGGQLHTTNELLANWLAGVGPVRAIRSFVAPGKLADCP